MILALEIMTCSRVSMNGALCSVLLNQILAAEDDAAC